MLGKKVPGIFLGISQGELGSGNFLSSVPSLSPPRPPPAFFPSFLQQWLSLAC